MMGQLMIITTPDLAPGFQLAGVETLVVKSPAQAEAALNQLLASNNASVVVICRSLLQGVSSPLKRQIEASYPPVVVDIPDGLPALFPQGTRRHQLNELIRRTIGFQMTFTSD
jgi:vacuolar-type H+-ATPase subunit F/Vma7